MFALRDVSQNLANLETAANFFNFKKIVRRSIIIKSTKRATNRRGRDVKPVPSGRDGDLKPVPRAENF